MLALNKDNAFLTAEVMCGNTTYYIMKINDKSVYLAKNKKSFYDWENKAKGVTWKEFCTKNDIIMTKYAGIFISALEISRGKTLAQSVSKKTKRYLSENLEAQVRSLHKRFTSKKGSWSHPLQDLKGKQAIIVKFVNTRALMRCETDFFYYDVETGEYTYYKRLGDETPIKGNIPILYMI